MKTKIVTGPVWEGARDFERKIRNLLKKGWSLNGYLQFLIPSDKMPLYAQIMIQDGGTNDITDYIILTTLGSIFSLKQQIKAKEKEGFRLHTLDDIKFKVDDVEHQLYYACMIK